MGLLLSYVGILSIGAVAVLFFMKRSGYRCGILEILSLSFFIGAGAVAYHFLIFSFLGINFTLSNSLFFAMSFVSVLFILMYTHKDKKIGIVPPRRGKKLDLFEKFLITAVVVEVAWVMIIALSLPVNAHDAVANYALKAKMFNMAGGIPAGYFAFSENMVAHPDYPLLLPFTMTWIYEFIGFDDYWVKTLMPVAYICFGTLFYSLVRKLFDRVVSVVAVFILFTVPQVADYAMVIHADLFLAAFVSCAFIYFAMYIKTNDTALLRISSVLFALSFWVKNEAIVFVAAFFSVFVLYKLRLPAKDKYNIKKEFLSILAIFIVIAAPLFAVKALYPVPNSDIDLAGVTVKGMIGNIKDIPILLNLFQQEVFGPKKWNIFWVLFFAAMIWKRNKVFKGEVKFFTVFLILITGGYFLAYMMMNGNNLYFYVNTTISRFMIHFAGICMFYMTYLVYDDVREILVGRGKVQKSNV